MILIEFYCDTTGCDANESVDVYFNDLQRGSEVRAYTPEGWQVIGCDVRGYALSRCPDHARHVEDQNHG